MKQFDQLIKHDLVNGLGNVIFEKDRLLSSCQVGESPMFGVGN
jgi:hypothetical protein